MSDITFDVTLANKIKRALIRNSVPDAADLDWIAAGDNIVKVRRLRLGHLKITTHEHSIDLDADPFVPDGCSVVEHHKGGQFTWDPFRVKLFLSKSQQGEGRVEGRKLREELRDEPVFNVNLLDYLLKHPYLIPEEWKYQSVFFWGTIYRSQEGHLFVRFLCRTRGKWRSSYYPLVHVWSVHYPSVVLEK